MCPRGRSTPPRGDRRRWLIELAAAVLSRVDVRLAQEVLEGGPHAVRRAVELAEMLACGRGERAEVLDVE